MDFEGNVMLEARLKRIEASLDAISSQQYNANILKALELRLFIASNFDGETKEKYMRALGAIELG